MWTVSFDYNDLTRQASRLLQQHAHERVGASRIDMQEDDFFLYKQAVEVDGGKLPVDGSASWLKGQTV